jgi:hypothetical protein
MPDVRVSTLVCWKSADLRERQSAWPPEGDHHDEFKSRANGCDIFCGMGGERNARALVTGNSGNELVPDNDREIHIHEHVEYVRDVRMADRNGGVGTPGVVP